MKGIFVTGTDTNVGKTWVGSRLIAALTKRNIDIVLRKPIESGWDENNIESTDAWTLAQAANKLDELNDICPNHFTHPVSPVRAAKLAGEHLPLELVKAQCLKNTNSNSFLYVEGAGGFYSPLCIDGLNADLASMLELPVLLVADNRLGCINQVLLTIEAIEKRGLALTAIVLNDASNNNCIHMNNFEDLKSLVSYPVIPIKHNHTEELFNEFISLIFPHINS